MTVSPGGIDAVLQAPAPAFSMAEAAAIGLAAFGIEASGARSLGSERDQAFLLTSPSGPGVAVLKVSNPAEDPDMLDMEAAAAFHAAACDPGLTIAIPRLPAPAADATSSSGDVPARRVRWEHGGTGYWVRAYDLLPGRARLDSLHARRPRADGVGRDDSPARPRPARLHPPPGDPPAPLGRPARGPGPADDERDRRPGRAVGCHRRA